VDLERHTNPKKKDHTREKSSRDRKEKKIKKLERKVTVGTLKSGEAEIPTKPSRRKLGPGKKDAMKSLRRMKYRNARDKF